MEGLSQESRALYDLLKADTTEEYERRFLVYKKEIRDAVKVFVDDTEEQFKSIDENLGEIQSKMGADLESVKESLGGDLAAVQGALSAEISKLAVSLDRVICSDPNASAGGSLTPPIWSSGGGASGPVGHRDEQQNRGLASAQHSPPPGKGTNYGQNLSPEKFPREQQFTDNSPSAPRVELPTFDGSHTKLWQRRCEEYFARWNTPSEHWTAYAASLFTGAAATWLESFLPKSPHASWAEFTQGVQTRFSRNQHQILVRKVFHIVQTGSVEDYVNQFVELLDMISAYEASPDPLHYLTLM